MVAEFNSEGIQFRYPENWQLVREDTEDGWTVSVQSPETAFLTISLCGDMPAPEEVAEQALAALREDYPELEAEDVIGSMAGQPAMGHDIRFFSLDLTNTAFTRCFYTSYGTVLVLCQFNDLESETNEPVLRAICASLQVED
jgi:hypothetical protein